MKRLSQVFLSVFSMFLFPQSAKATESVDCVGNEFSISIVINLSDDSFGGYSIYKGTTMITGGWANNKAVINTGQRHISFTAHDNILKDISFSVLGINPGKLVINGQPQEIDCDWEAF